MSEPKHEIRKIKHETRFRHIEVLRTERITPRTIRVTFGGEELRGFATAAFDNHVKLVFPMDGQDRPIPGSMETGKLSFPGSVTPPPFRDYTPRRYDPVANELDIEFSLHGDGPASAWAAQSRPGQVIGIAGPKGSQIVPDDFHWHLLIGDDTALPAISRRLEELPAGTRVVAVVEVEDRAEQRPLQTQADVDLHWLFRTEEDAGDIPLLRRLKQIAFPDGDCYTWIAGETEEVRAVRKYLIEERGLNKAWMKVAGYWRRGAAGVHDKLNE